MNVTLLIAHHLEFISFKGGCTGSSESTLVKIPHCWKSHVAAQICYMNEQKEKCTFPVKARLSMCTRPVRDVLFAPVAGQEGQ